MSESGELRGLITRYLRQRAELGERRLFFDTLSAQGALDLLRSARRPGYEPTPSRPAPKRPKPAPPSGGGRGSASPMVQKGSPEFEELRSEVLGCTLCRLAQGRTTVVFGEGDPEADLMVVGEAPGSQEDRTGRPFVGPAGQLLDKMLMAVGFERSEVFICNVLKCRPPQNRDPLPDEVASCRPYLRRQVESIAPKAICAFGRFAAQALLNSDQSLGRLRGQAHDFMGAPVVATYHPAALLRNSRWKRPAWEDLQFLRRVYDEAGGRKPRGDVG